MAIATSARFGESELSYLISFYKSLSEKDRRRFAAIEAKRLGHGGATYVAQIFGCSTKTISRGIDELDSLDQDPAAGRVRSPGAGRKKTSPPGQKSSKTYSR
jgi:hypothetical protein